MGKFKDFLMSEKISAKQAMDLIKNIKEITIKNGEAGFSKLKNKKYKNPKDVQKVITHVPPDVGYDKLDVLIKLKDGQEIKGFRFDYSKNNRSFETALINYMKYSLTDK